jgi:hypothetical protein
VISNFVNIDVTSIVNIAAIQPSAMTEEKRQIFLDAFKSLGLPVIWKWDAEVRQDKKQIHK